MGVIGGRLGYHLLRKMSPRGSRSCCAGGGAYAQQGKLDVLLGAEFWEELRGKVVIDFGCGTGSEAIAMAKRGASKVIGVDIRESVLAQARERAREERVEDRCCFATETGTRAQLVLSVDAFEHFADPAAILDVMASVLEPDGSVWIAFGPSWYHPAGGHLFSVFPWAHLVFTEAALIRWRSDFKSDGATRFSEVEGGLNQMTIRRFERLVAASRFRFDRYELVPIRRLKHLSTRITREFCTSVVRCQLVFKT